MWLRIRIRILLSSSKNSKKNLDSYCFVYLGISGLALSGLTRISADKRLADFEKIAVNRTKKSRTRGEKSRVLPEVEISVNNLGSKGQTLLYTSTSSLCVWNFRNTPYCIRSSIIAQHLKEECGVTQNELFLSSFSKQYVTQIGGWGRRGAAFNFIYRRPTLYPLEIAVDFLKSL